MPNETIADMYALRLAVPDVIVRWAHLDEGWGEGYPPVPSRLSTSGHISSVMWAGPPKPRRMIGFGAPDFEPEPKPAKKRKRRAKKAVR